MRTCTTAARHAEHGCLVGGIVWSVPDAFSDALYQLLHLCFNTIGVCVHLGMHGTLRYDEPSRQRARVSFAPQGCTVVLGPVERSVQVVACRRMAIHVCTTVIRVRYVC